MQAYQSITVDLLRPGFTTVYAAQDDTGTRGVLLSLVMGGVPWTPPDGTVAIVEVRKPDGTECVYDTLEDGETSAYSIEGSRITILWAAQALTAPGDALAAIRFYNADGERLTTFAFRLRIPVGACPDSGITSSDYYSILTQQIAALLGATTHPPQIDPASKHWLTWDEIHGGYADSGYSSVGQPGPPEIPTTTVVYQAGTSPTTAPTGTWETTPPAVAAGEYLWTRTVLTYSNGTTATSYSVARQGSNGGGTLMQLYSNQTVAASSWVSDSTYTDYPYHADVACPGITVSDFAEVILDIPDATGGNFAPVCETRTDAVRIWAASVPDAAITIPTIAVWR